MLLRRSSLLSLLLSSFALLTTAATGCASSDGTEDANSQAGADSIAPFDDPEHLLGTVSRKLADNITEADIGKTFGTPDNLVPYPDTYWPMEQDGINVQWNGNQPSPLAKYMGMTDPGSMSKAAAWNSQNSGKDVPGVQGWFGICHGWTGAAISEAPVTHAAYARVSGDTVSACQPSEVGQNGCTKFEIGDINALLATIYADGGSKFIGARCDTSPNDIKRDADGRIDRQANGAGCKGLNAGSLMIVLGHRMKRDQKPMAIDAQNASNTDQIWNQPAYRYTVNNFQKIDEATATYWVTNQGRYTGGYTWNSQAKGFAYVDLSVHWVSEHGPNTTYVSGLQSTHKTKMAAVLELDKPATDPSAQIIGGELLDNVEGTDRLQNHPFVWLSTGPGRDTGRSGHNPYVKASVVKQLVELGRN